MAGKTEKFIGLRSYLVNLLMEEKLKQSGVAGVAWSDKDYRVRGPMFVRSINPEAPNMVVAIGTLADVKAIGKIERGWLRQITELSDEQIGPYGLYFSTINRVVATPMGLGPGVGQIGRVARVDIPADLLEIMDKMAREWNQTAQPKLF